MEVLRQFFNNYLTRDSFMHADLLESAESYNVYVSLTGEASCMFYKTLFETTHQKTCS